ncbi:MAG: dimethylarginine dimethylaminohydrolase family protein [Myxococcota bacterium]
MSAWRRTLLMGDPAHFSVKGGGNPHTRTRWGRKRSVDRARAIDQWHGLKARLEELGISVVVVPPIAENPGSVYPANAGVMSDVDAEKPLAEKTFTLSNLLPTRAGEKPHYREVLESLGVRCAELDESLRFEGEADFFPVDDFFVLTCGHLERQRFVPTLGLPPWKRVYGFRTDARVEPILADQVAPRPVVRIQLTLEAHYHGDTALCAFGPGRRYLLAYREALEPGAWEKLEARLGDRMIELSEPDAKRYAANSFTYTRPDAGESFLFMPGGVSGALQDEVRSRGVEPVVVDVSEFLKKGGGSVKCMIGDLGPVRGGDPEG